MTRMMVCAVLLFAAGCASTQIPRPDTAAKPPERKDGLKAYADIVTKEAVSDSGVFIVHRVKQKWYYEVPLREIGREFLFVTSQERTQNGTGYGGDNINQHVVRWDRNGDDILLRSVLFSTFAADSLPVSYAVQKASNPPILAVLNIVATTPDSSAVLVEVTDLFLADMTEFGLGRREREAFKVRRLDQKRSYVEGMTSFPDNIESRVMLTYDAAQVPEDNMLSSISILMHHSMVRLPDRPMMPRLEDARVGFFSVALTDYGYNSHRAERRSYIARWRLEPSDTAAFLRGELVEPVKPIVFYIDRGVPDKWRPWLKKGVEAWQPAFEKAGFARAIIAKDAPTVGEDPAWSSEDARFSTIRWLPSTTENAYGPHISDPRTGEILDADIGFFHNVMNLANNWYFVQAGASDPRARTLPLPDSLIGELIEYIAAHEVGHSLGFPHNMKATSQYPVDSLRSPTFTAVYGTEASIMDYGRFNYVAQPGDGARLIPIVGPYDKFAVEWGYRPVIGARTPDDEKEVLDRIALRQEQEPFLRFGSIDGVDPTAQREDLGDDPVKAARYGLANIRRVADMLVSAVTKKGEDFARLREVYGRLVGQRNWELVHVAGVIGGVVKTEKVGGQEGPVHRPVPRDRQREALRFLLEEGFRTPREILNPGILSLIEPSGSLERVLRGHRQLLTAILGNGRMSRLVNQEGLPSGERPYRLSEMLSDLREGIWSELGSQRVTADPYRRNLQREYLDLIDTKLNPEAPPRAASGDPAAPEARRVPPGDTLPGDARSLLRDELRQLDRAIGRALPGATTREMRAHLNDCRDRITRILHPDGKPS